MCHQLRLPIRLIFYQQGRYSCGLVKMAGYSGQVEKNECGIVTLAWCFTKAPAEAGAFHYKTCLRNNLARSSFGSVKKCSGVPSSTNLP